MALRYRYIPLQYPEQTDLQTALRYVGERGEAAPSELEILRSCDEQLRASCTPRGVALRCEVQQLSGVLAGQDIRRHLAGCPEAFLLCVTLGTAADGLIRKAASAGILEQAAMDAVASAAMEQVCDQAEQYLRGLLQSQGLYLTGRFSPGYGDYDLGMQPAFCRLLDTNRKVGVAVCAGGLLTPMKSVTAVLGIAPQPVSGYRAGCDHCKLRETCNYRKRGLHCEG